MVPILAAFFVLTSLPEAPPAELGFDPVKLSRVDGVIEKAIAAEQIPGAVLLVARHGKIAYVKAYGNRATQPNVEPMTRDTIFDMASLTKPIATAPSVMVLVEQGKLALDDPLEKHLPEFASHGKGAITVEQLLRHRAGLVPDDPISDYEDGPDTAWKKLADLELSRKPGERFAYSDVGFIYLGKVVEHVSGQTLDRFAREHVFQPMGLESTSFRPLGASNLLDPKRIAPTEKDESGNWLRGVVHDPRSRALGGVAGHAGLFSTVDDVAVFAQTLLNQGVATNGTRVFTTETIRRMLDPGDTPPGQKRGLGWDIDTPYNCPKGHFGLRSFGHTGFTGTSLWIDPDTETIVVLLTSRLHAAKQGSALNALRREAATIVADAIVDTPTARGVRCGIDMLISQEFAPIRGKRIGLVTNHTGRARDGRSTIDVLAKAPDVTLVRLFSPEHGIRGAVDRPVADDRDETTGLPIVSLYGAKRKPTPEDIEGLDAIVYDIQDIGARYYTYISTLGLILEAASEKGIEAIVLDRPNPIGGVAVGGPVRDPGFASFIAYHDLPVRHGMTVGELAKMFQEERSLRLPKLTVVACAGWRRGDLYDQTGLLWINPSPNMRSLTEALLYPGVGLLESTNLATGRGTDTPFERVGAPYIDLVVFARALNSLKLPGVTFVPIRFQPSERQFAGSDCGGVFIQITDRTAFDPIDLGLGLAHVLRKLYPEQWKPDGFRSMLADQTVYEAMLAGKPPAELRALCREEEKAFEVRRKPYLIYSE